MIIKAPAPVLWSTYDKPTIFLAGSIEMGKAEDWQDWVGRALEPKFVVLNPRRDDWDSSWKQSKDDPNFRQQVEWELSGQFQADVRFIYFSPETMSPITLLELGLFMPELVVCGEGFWRKGNVDIVCERYGINQCPTLDEAVKRLLTWELS